MTINSNKYTDVTIIQVEDTTPTIMTTASGQNKNINIKNRSTEIQALQLSIIGFCIIILTAICIISKRIIFYGHSSL